MDHAIAKGGAITADLGGIICDVCSHCSREASFFCSFQEAFPSSRMNRTEKRAKKCLHGIYHATQSRHVQDGVVLPGFEANECRYRRTSCRKRELLSPIGHLNSAAAVAAPGRTFLCHLIELSSMVCHFDHHMYLHSDLFYVGCSLQRTGAG